jgi:hypothetical protein
MTWEDIVRVISPYSISIVATIALLRFRKVLKSYRPFLYFSIVAFLNEIISTLSIKYYGSNTINYNIYTLIEALLILWQFRNWGLQQAKKKLYVIIGAILVGLWIVEYLVIHSLHDISSIYLICYHFVLIFLSIDQMNYVLITERKDVLKNSRFIISTILLISYTYEAILEVFFYIDLKASHAFYHYIILIFLIINLFMNLLLALAALWIPTKQRFTLPY